jgi:hypothetical protein
MEVAWIIVLREQQHRECISFPDVGLVLARQAVSEVGWTSCPQARKQAD